MKSQVISADSAIGTRIMERVADYKERGERYPTLLVDDLASVPRVWLGRTCYHAETLERLRMTSIARRTPVRLPDDHILDGDGRLPRETDVQYRKYLAYRDIAPAERTVAEAVRRYGGRYTADWTNLASRMRWAERAALWDSELAARTQIALEKNIDAVVDEYAEKRAKYLEREINLVDKVYTRLEEMVSLPATDKRVETSRETVNGHTTITHVTHWHAANWSYGDISKLVAEVDKIARLHYGMPTSNAAMKIENSVSGTIGVVQSGQKHDFGHLSPDERADHEYAARMAEDAYFNALEERQRQSTQSPLALVR